MLLEPEVEALGGAAVNFVVDVMAREGTVEFNKPSEF